MKPRKAFKVSSDIEISDCGKSSVSIEAMSGLLDLLKPMNPADPKAPAGGEIELRLDNGKVFRLTFCDFTGLTICPFCHGTGAKPENAN